MVATKNQTVVLLSWLLGVIALITACGPSGPRALVQGQKYLAAGETDAAIEALQRAVQLMPTNAAAWNYLGVAFHRAGQWTNATAAYSHALRYDRELLETRFNLGCLWLDQDQPELAKTELTAYTLRRANDAEGWSKLGSAQLAGRDLVGAEKSFREALRLAARNVEALNGIGMVFAQHHRGRDAVDSFTAALQVQPQYPAALLNLATVLQQQLNNPAEALKRYREYLSLQPRPADWEAVNAVVRSLEQPTQISARAGPAGNTLPTNTVASPVSRAQQPMTPAPRPTAAPPSKPESQPVVAKVTPSSPAPNSVAPPPVENRVAAPDRSAVEPAVKIEADTAPVVRRAESPPPPVESKGLFAKLNPFKRDGKASVPENRPGAAPADPDAYAALKAGGATPGDRKAAEAALVQGQQAQRAKRLAEALQFYRRAVHLDESYFEAHYCLGLAAFEMRSFKLATTAWQNAISIRPDSVDAHYNYALTLKADGRFREASDELERLLGVHPDEARAHLTLGILCAEDLRDIPRARLHYNKVLQLDPRNPQAAAIRYWLVANPR